MKKKPFIAIIGGRKSGKSTIIKSLTGCKNSSFVGPVIEHINGQGIYVIAHSPQEKRVEQLEKRICDAAKDDKILGVVIAIQPTKPTKRPSIEEIISLAKDNNYSIYAFIINPPYKEGEGLDVDSIKERLEIPNKNISEIDGRCFAIENAKYIQDEAGLTKKMLCKKNQR